MQTEILRYTRYSILRAKSALAQNPPARPSLLAHDLHSATEKKRGIADDDVTIDRPTGDLLEDTCNTDTLSREIYI